MATPAPSPPESFESVYGVRKGWILAIDAIVVAMFPIFGWLLALADTHFAAVNALRTKLGIVGLPYTLSFLTASALAARLAHAASRRREARSMVWTYTALAGFTFFVAMEHISWGQVVFHYRTPFGYGHVNRLGLLNLHNLPLFDDLHSVFLLLCGLAGLIGLRVASRPRHQHLGVPRVLAPIVYVITFMAAFTIFTNLVYLGFTFDMNVFLFRYAIEFAIGILCLLTVWLNGRALYRAWDSRARQT